VAGYCPVELVAVEGHPPVPQVWEKQLKVTINTNSVVNFFIGFAVAKLMIFREENLK